MGNKTEDRWRKARADKKLKTSRRQKQRRLEVTLEKIRGRCSTCGKIKVQIGKKKYACPDNQKHLHEAEKQEG